MRKLRTANPELIELVRFLKKQSRENEAPIWHDVAEKLARSRRKRITVNISHLNRYTEKNEQVVVPGKVLGAGEIDHPIAVTALAFSTKAKEKVSTAGGKCLSFTDLIGKNPKGSKVRIIG